MTIAIVSAVAVPTAAVLALAVNAHRVTTLPERFTKAMGGDGDAMVVQPSGRPLTDDIRVLPTVRYAESLTFVWGGPTTPPPGGEEPETNMFAVTDIAATGTRVVSGRAPSPEAPHEFVSNRAFVRAFELDIGDHLTFATASQRQVDESVVLNEDPEGPTIDGVLVGVVDGPADFDDPSATVLFPSTLLEQPVGIVATLVPVRLTPGTTLDEFRASLNVLPGHEQLFFQPARVVSESVRDALRTQAIGDVILVIVAGVATVAAVGQLLLRQRAAGPNERTALLSLGYTGRQSALEGIVWAAIVIVAGIALAAVGSLLLTPFVPRGFGRRIDPAAGQVLLDPVILLAAALLTLGLVGWVAVGILVSRPPTAEQPSAAAETLARSLRPEAATGVRFAFGGGRNGRPAALTTAALTVAIAAMLAAAVVASNIDALTGDPARYGSDFEYITGNSFGTGEPMPWPPLDTLDGVQAASFVATGSALLRGQDVDVVGFEPVHGSLLPPVIDGAFPASADEVAMGRVTARELGVQEGDEITLTSGAGTEATYRVVGEAVLPNPSFGAGGGHGVAMLLSGWRRLEPAAEANSLMLDLETGASVPDELQPFAPQTADEQTQPADVVNLDRSRGVPTALAVVIGALGMLTLGHALLLSVRQRRRELAVLRSLGADRRWVGRAVHAQASALTAAALVIGVPAGLAVGQWLFRSFVDRLGLVPSPITPVLLLLLIGVGALLVANLAAALPARRARHTPVAALLHSE
jgi:FtsX-like permease family